MVSGGITMDFFVIILSVGVFSSTPQLLTSHFLIYNLKSTHSDFFKATKKLLNAS